MPTYLDAKWFERFCAIGLLSPVDLLVGDPKTRAEQKQLFLSGKIDRPLFDYPLLQTFPIADRLESLQRLADEIRASEKNQVIKEAYARLIAEKICHLHLLQATRDKDDKRFDEITVKEFGEVRPEHCYKLIPQVRDLARQAQQSKQAPSVRAAEYLQDFFASWPADEKNAVCPTFEIDRSPLQDAAAIQHAFQQAFAANKISGWNVSLDEQNLNAFVHINQEKKELIVPTRRTLTQRHLEALVRHEVGVHICRSVNAQKTKLQLLTIGLDHYLRGEEGLAKHEEMRTLPSSFEIYLGTGLIKGVDGRKRDFRETYEFFKQYYLASQFYHDEVSEQQAVDESWTRAEKFFRGTTGQSAGICFTKDLMYLEGYLSILQTIKDHPEEEKRFFAAKYDPSNAFHRQVLDEVGVV